MHSACKYLKDVRLYGRIIFMPNVSLYLEFNSMAEKEGSLRVAKKDKREN